MKPHEQIEPLLHLVRQLETSAAVDGAHDNHPSIQTKQLYQQFETAVRQTLEAAAAGAEPAPIDMILYCPTCHEQHIDGPEHGHACPIHYHAHATCGGSETGCWDNPRHRTHLCHYCGGKWRPAEVATNGVAAIQNAGKAAHAQVETAPFQGRVQPWLMACFGPMIAGDKEERNHRFLEEALELVQACGCGASEAHQLVDYVYGRPVGEPAQEVGGVMVTLAALCLAHGFDMHAAGETELTRIWTKVETIRAKQAAKPKYSPLPVAHEAAPDIQRTLRRVLKGAAEMGWIGDHERDEIEATFIKPSTPDDKPKPEALEPISQYGSPELQALVLARLKEPAVAKQTSQQIQRNP